MSWRQNKTDKREVDWHLIKRELEGIGNIEKVDILDINHVEFLVDSVKISFYANPNYSPLPQEELLTYNNLKVADLLSIGAMKMEVMLRRSKFRDYYDIYTLIEKGIGLQEMIQLALKYSGHRLKSKNLIAMLTRSERFAPDSGFASLNPLLKITPQEIEERLIEELRKGDRN